MTKDEGMKRASGVYKRQGSVNWCFQRKVPDDLRHLYESPWAIQVTLRTPDLAEANRRATRLWAQWDTAFELQRRQLAQAVEPAERVTPELGRLAAQQTLHTLLANEAVRTNQPLRRDYLRYYQRLAWVGLQQAAEEMGVGVDKSTPGMVEATQHYVLALKEAEQQTLLVQPPRPEAKPAKGKTLRDVFDRWKAREPRGRDTVSRAEASLAMFEQQTGNPPLQALTRDHGEAFCAWLGQQPGASKTKHDKLTSLKTLLNYARQDLEWLSRNPWEGLDIAHKTEQQRFPWTDAQVQAFFSLPLFQRYELPVNRWKSGGAAAYWVPILGLYTGARIGELCQLRSADILSRDGQAFISINDAEGKSLKTAASRREIPMHSELKRLGLLDYAQAMREAAEVQLWPQVKFRDGKASGYFSDWFGDLRKLVPGTPDFHSLRHTVRTKMTEAGIVEAIQDRITGHSVKGSTGTRVYSHPVEILRKAVESIQYPGLVLPKC